MLREILALIQRVVIRILVKYICSWGSENLNRLTLVLVDERRVSASANVSGLHTGSLVPMKSPEQSSSSALSGPR